MKQLQSFDSFMVEYGLDVGPWAVTLRVLDPGSEHKLHLAAPVTGLTVCGRPAVGLKELSLSVDDFLGGRCRSCRLPEAFVVARGAWRGRCVVLYDALASIAALRDDGDFCERLAKANDGYLALEHYRDEMLDQWWGRPYLNLVKPDWDRAARRVLGSYCELIGDLVGLPCPVAESNGDSLEPSLRPARAG